MVALPALIGLSTAVDSVPSEFCDTSTILLSDDSHVIEPPSSKLMYSSFSESYACAVHVTGLLPTSHVPSFNSSPVIFTLTDS